MRYLISIKYDGSKFHGFQRLKNEDSVQGVLEEALAKIFKMPILIKGAGRTDRGVHAYDQKAHFDLDINIDCNHLKKILNKVIKPYIYIHNCTLVADDFHARFLVKQKTYMYKINLGDYNPLYEDYMLQDVGMLDIEKMKKASTIFLGVHDFRNFVSGMRDDYTAVIYNIDFKIQDNILEIKFVGKSFYRYMVRSLVGALLDIGKKKVEIEDLKNSLILLNNKRFSVALAKGLYLMNISYN